MLVKSKKNQKGLAATEYIIGLILVAVGSVAMFSIFGAQIKAKIAQATAAISGDDASFKTATGLNSDAMTKSLDRASKGNSMKGDVGEITYGAAAAGGAAGGTTPPPADGTP